MKFKKEIIAGVVLFMSVAAQAKDANTNFSDCLSALNTKTLVFKGKVKPIADDGQTFAVTNYLGLSSTVVFTPNGAFSISQKQNPYCQAFTGFPGTEPKDTANAIMGMIVTATAMGNDPQNSNSNKSALIKTCMRNPSLAKLWNQPVGSASDSNGGAVAAPAQ